MTRPWVRIIRRLKEEVWQRQLPHGLVGWSYLWPTGDPRVRLHQRLWWLAGARWPRSLWFLVQCFLWLRWVFFGAWVSSWRVVRDMGPEVQQQHDISRPQQFLCTLRLALRWCIAPRDVYRFSLYLDPNTALDYVHDQESSAYHLWRSQPLGVKPASLRCIQDKVALAELMQREGVPTVSTLQQIKAGSRVPLAQAMGSQTSAFCKMNSGNQGRAAFAVWRTDDGLLGQLFTGQPLVHTAAVETAWQQLLALDDALVQPLLTNHPALAALAFGDEAITVRFITEWQAASLVCLCATLEVPAGKNKHGQTFYSIWPITHTTGELQTLEQAPAPKLTLPCWPALVEGSLQAHRQFPDVCAIAWDWVITPEGPLLLEGNAGWGPATPQLLSGGFLKGFSPASAPHTAKD